MTIKYIPPKPRPEKNPPPPNSSEEASFRQLIEANWVGMVSILLGGISFFVFAVFIVMIFNFTAELMTLPGFDSTDPSSINPELLELSSGMMIAFACWMGSGVLGLTGLALGVGGLRQPSATTKGWAIAGTMINGMYICGIGFCFLVSLLSAL